MAPERAPRLGGRRALLLAVLLAGLTAFLALGIGPGSLAPRAGGLALAGRFLGRALSPDLGAETLRVTLEATWTTVRLAAAALGLAILLALPLGFLASTAWWRGEGRGGRGRLGRAARALALPGVYAATRATIAFLRSVHELLWAVLLGAALGRSPLTGVLAIAIPYAGILAKVFSEIVDEAPRGPALALRAAGASPLQVFSFALVPAALPDLAAYAFYRFECALRSAAVLGFFGYLTLGHFIEEAFKSGDLGAVWTYLYATLLLVAFFDAWSGRLRRAALT